MTKRIWTWLCEINIGAFILIISFAALLTGVIIGEIAGELADRKWESHYRETYAAWCKLENRHDISHDEWKRLRDAGILRSWQ